MMKKLLLTLAFIMTSAFTAHAQVIITTLPVPDPSNFVLFQTSPISIFNFPVQVYVMAVPFQSSSLQLSFSALAHASTMAVNVGCTTDATVPDALIFGLSFNQKSPFTWSNSNIQNSAQGFANVVSVGGFPTYIQFPVYGCAKVFISLTGATDATQTDTWRAQGTFSNTSIVPFGVGGYPATISMGLAAGVPTPIDVTAAGTLCPTGVNACGVQGAGATGAAIVGNPLLNGGKDTSGNTQPILVSASGVQVNAIQNATGDGAANSGAYPQSSSGSTGIPWVTENYLFNGATWDRARSVAPSGQGLGAALVGGALSAPADGLSNANMTSLPNTGGNNSTPLLESPFLFNGVTWDRQVKCPTVVPITLGAAGTLQIVAPVAGQKVRVCAIVITESVAGTIQLTEGTGATCNVGTTSVTGVMTGTLSEVINLAMGPTSVIQTNVAGDGLCLVNGAATIDAGYAMVEQH